MSGSTPDTKGVLELKGQATETQSAGRARPTVLHVALVAEDVDTVRGWKEEAKAGFLFRITEVN